MTTFAERAIERLSVWMTPDLERYLRAIGAMFTPLEELTEEVGSDGETGYLPPYGRIFDPDLCPYDALGYLGQYVGASVPAGASETEARALVKAESGLNRGTRSSLESAIQRSISNPWKPLTAVTTGQLLSHEVTGTVAYYKVVTSFTTPASFNTTHLEVVSITAQYFLLEREKPDGEEAAYHLTIVVRPEQLTPAANPAALEANVRSVKPAGLIMHIIETDEGPLIDEGTIPIEEALGVIETATLADIT
jgi:hypothetical protein